MTDQHRWDAMGAYGNAAIRTPHLDRLAGEGVRFERYYVAAFPCSPSRASIVTGLHPQSHGVLINNIKLDESLPTFGTELAAAGYHTTWMGKWHLGGPKALARDGDGVPTIIKMEGRPPGEEMPQNGFQDGVSYGRKYREHLEKLGLWPRGARGLFTPGHSVIKDGHVTIPEEHWMEGFVTTEAISYLEQRAHSGTPFCLCVSYHGPHRPMTPPEPWDKMYDPQSLPLPASINDPMTKAPASHRDFGWRMCGLDLARERARLNKRIVYANEMWDLLERPAWTEREYRELLAHYYGYVSYIDAQIGRLLDALTRVGLADNTLVIYTTDHGEFMGNHGCIFKGMMMYDDLVRVPLLVRFPGAIPPHTVTRALASSVDLMPTLLDFAAVPTPKGLHGKSLRPLLEGRVDEHHQAVYTSFPAPNVQMRMVRTPRYKYSLNWRPRQINELYDMDADPFEMDNLAGRPEMQRVEQDLQGTIYDFMDRIKDPWRKIARSVGTMPPLTRIAFDFDQEYEWEYWSFHRGLSSVKIADGKLVGRITCPGYMVAHLDEPVQGNDYPTLEITMATTAGEQSQFYWATTERPQMCEAMSVRFALESDGKLHTYRLKLAENENWRDKTITHIRLNPIRRKLATEPLSGRWEIDRIGPSR